MRQDKDNTFKLEGEALEQFLLSLAENVISQQQPMNSEMIRIFGQLTMVGGRLIIKGVPVEMVAKQMNENARIPYEFSIGFVNALYMMIKTVKLSDPDGTKFNIKIKRNKDFSFQQDQNDLLEITASCGNAFKARDYAKCEDIAKTGLKNYSEEILFQFLVVSLQRTNQLEEVEKQGERAISVLHYFPLDKALMEITLGIINSKDLFANSKNDIQRSRVLLYEGIRLITMGKPKEAIVSLSKCIQLQKNNFANINAMELFLAGTEMELLSN